MFPSLSKVTAAAVAGILLSHLSHAVSTMILYHLSKTIAPAFTSFRSNGLSSTPPFPFIVSLLHIVSPAGIFLSAPYAESPFAALTFLAHFLQAHALKAHFSYQRTKRDTYLLLSGITCGVATTFRSNGILNILTYLYLALLFPTEEPSKLHQLHYITILGISCFFTALGSIIPQALAWHEYCFLEPNVTTARELMSACIHKGSRNPSLQINYGECTTHLDRVLLKPNWCNQTIPSIYTYVQEHYWDVGFLRYWTLSNIPLFILAAPVLILMAISAWKCLVLLRWPIALVGDAHNEERKRQDQGSKESRFTPSPDPAEAVQHPQTTPLLLLHAIALPQVILTFLALILYHIQIITRLSSAYPVMYWYLASLILDDTHVTFTWPPGVWVWARKVSRGWRKSDGKEEEEYQGRKRKEQQDLSRVDRQEDTKVAGGKEKGKEKGKGKTGEGRHVEKEMTGSGGEKVNIGEVIVRGWICYAMVQALLFGGFLPPA